MSYCVHCGVELAPSEIKCPLCHTMVADPSADQDKPRVRAYPAHIARLNDKVNRRFAVSIASVFMILSGVICVLLNYIYEGEISWSMYVLGGIALAWILVMSPFVFSRHAVIKATLLDGISIIGYLYIIENITEQKDWVAPLAVPIVLAAGMMTIILGLTISSKLIKGLHIPAAILAGAGLLSILVESRADMYNQNLIHLDWSLIVAVVTFAVAILFLLLERKKRIKNEIKKRLHI